MNWYKEAQSGIAVWLDDERDPQSDIGRQKGASGSEIWIKTAPEAIKLLESGNVASISLDHDLGPTENGSGYDVAKWIEEQAYHGNLPKLQWALHSDNPVGVKNMRAALEQANKFWERNELTKEAQATYDEANALDWASRYKVEMTPDGMFVLYHGTIHAKEIRESGFFRVGSNFETDANDAYNWAYRKMILSYPVLESDTAHMRAEQEVEVMKIKAPSNKLSLGIWAIALEPIPVIEI